MEAISVMFVKVSHNEDQIKTELLCPPQEHDHQRNVPDRHSKNLSDSCSLGRYKGADQVYR